MNNDISPKLFMPQTFVSEKMKRIISHALISLSFAIVLELPAHSEEIPIGISTALTGDAAESGVDIKNALVLANDMLGGGKYKLIFEDEKCSNRDAVAVATKLTSVDKAQYILGFPCNSSLLAAAPVYERAKVLVLSSSSTGDVADVGHHIFRLFPSDSGCAETLYGYIAKHHKHLRILTEQNEYPVLMERVIRTENDKATQKISIESDEFIHGQQDLRALTLKVRSSEAVFVNANTDQAFIAVVKLLSEQKFQGTIYAAYVGSSPSLREILGKQIEGMAFCNMPLVDELVGKNGKAIFAEFRKRFGEPKSGFPVAPIAFESFRLLNEVIQSGQKPGEYLKNKTFKDGFLPPYHFDEHGAVQGIQFQMQRVQDGKVVVLPSEGSRTN